MPDFGSRQAAGKNELDSKPSYTGSQYGVSLAIPLSDTLFAPSTVSQPTPFCCYGGWECGTRVADSACERACDEGKTKAGVKMADGLIENEDTEIYIHAIGG